MPDPRFRPRTPFTEEQLAEVEAALGARLPSSYRSFALEFGGAFVAGTVDGSEDLPIDGFIGSTGYGLLETLEAHRDFKEVHALPIADCILGNLWVLSADGAVHFINYYGGTTTGQRVAESFDNFLERIVVEDDDDQDSNAR